MKTVPVLLCRKATFRRASMSAGEGGSMQTRQLLPIHRLLADADYDSEAHHQWLRETCRIESIIPARLWPTLEGRDRLLGRQAPLRRGVDHAPLLVAGPASARAQRDLQPPRLLRLNIHTMKINLTKSQSPGTVHRNDGGDGARAASAHERVASRGDRAGDSRADGRRRLGRHEQRRVRLAERAHQHGGGEQSGGDGHAQEHRHHHLDQGRRLLPGLQKS